jgi:hypothetical protein
MKIEPVHQQGSAQQFSVKAKPAAQAEITERLAIRRAPSVSDTELKVAKMKAEIDFDRVKEIVRKSTPKGAYPPLEGIDRLSNLFGKLDS